MNPDLALHVTHGESAVNHLEDAGIAGQCLSWDDVLHEGPIPAGLGLDQLTQTRVLYLAAQRWGTVSSIGQSMRSRNATLREFAPDGEVYLWNTPELFDQLHLWQILGWYADEGARLPRPHLVTIDDYFSSLGDGQAHALLAAARRIDDATVAQGAALWAALRAADPTRLVESRGQAPGLGFTDEALLRYLEEYPAAEGGLSRTERQILEGLLDGPSSPIELFTFNREVETVAFMGDWSFWRIIDRMIDVPEPPLDVVGGDAFAYPPRLPGDSDRFRRQQLRLTRFGRRVLDGAADFVGRNGIDRWQGGVHLKAGSVWRWDGARLRRS